MPTEVKASLDLTEHKQPEIRFAHFRTLSLRPVGVCRGFPIRSMLDYAEFTLSERSESNGLRSE